MKDQSQLQNKEKELKKLSDLLIKLEEKSQADSEAVQVAQDHFHAVSAGLSSNEGGEDKTLADQIMSKFITTFLDGVCFSGWQQNSTGGDKVLLHYSGG